MAPRHPPRSRSLCRVGSLLAALILTACGGAQSNTGGSGDQAPSTRDRYEARERIQQQREHMESLLQGSVEESGLRENTTEITDAPARTLQDDAEGPAEEEAPAPPPLDTREVPLTRACERTCGVAEDLCFSSQEICGIASRYPGEREFQETCTWAINTCANARTQCESCSP